MKEDHCLFGMADQAFSPAEQARLLEQFEQVEQEHLVEGTHQRFLDVAERLARRYGVVKPAAVGQVCGCGHH